MSDSKIEFVIPLSDEIKLFTVIKRYPKFISNVLNYFVQNFQYKPLSYDKYWENPPNFIRIGTSGYTQIPTESLVQSSYIQIGDSFEVLELRCKIQHIFDLVLKESLVPDVDLTETVSVLKKFLNGKLSTTDGEFSKALYRMQCLL